jgi:hypothetical protein
MPHDNKHARQKAIIQQQYEYCSVWHYEINVAIPTPMTMPTKQQQQHLLHK